MGTSMSVRTMGFRTHSTPRYVTPSRPSLKGSMPPMDMVPEGARRLPERRRRRVLFPAPLAVGGGLAAIMAGKGGDMRNRN